MQQPLVSHRMALGKLETESQLPGNTDQRKTQFWMKHWLERKEKDEAEGVCSH